MGNTAFWAPAHRLLQRGPGSETSWTPPNASPSADYLATGLQDHRLPYNKYGNSGTAATGVSTLGWYGGSSPTVVDQVPAVAAVNNIAVAAHVVQGTAMTLVSSTAAGITVLSSATTVWPSLTSIPANTLAIDGAPGLKKFGLKTITAFYDPTLAIARAVSITDTAGSGGHFIVSGYDVYGYAMSEDINQAGSSATTNGKKAFKFITSVVPQFTDANNYSVGTADVFGFNLRTDRFSDVFIWWNSALVTANSGYTAAVTTAANTTTGDVRGTYAVTSDGVKRFVARVRPPLAAIQSNATTGLFGVTQA
jgi:hypothetical protein